MTAAPVSLQDLRRRIYVKAKAEKTWRCWGLYVHVAKLETLRAAYAMAKENNGAPGLDGVTFEAIEAAGVEGFLAQLRDELVTRTYRPLRNRRVEIRVDDGRHYLETTDAKFDAITSDPLDPWVKGAAALYTTEFWQLVKSRLNPGGVVTVFVQVLPELKRRQIRRLLESYETVGDPAPPGGGPPPGSGSSRHA